MRVKPWYAVTSQAHVSGEPKGVEHPFARPVLLVSVLLFALLCLPSMAAAEVLPQDVSAEIGNSIGADVNFTDEVRLTDAGAAAELPHSDLDRSEVVTLLEGVFEPLLQGAAGPFDDLEAQELLSNNAAVILGRDAPEPSAQIGADLPVGAPEDRRLLESTLPISREGEIVDLSLRREGPDLEAVNPLVGVMIPGELGDGIQMPEAGLTVELVGAPGDRAPSAIDSVAVYPNVATDTDLLIAPVPTGLETMTSLRSAQAPTSQTFRLDLPAETQLRASAAGGAEVVDPAGQRKLVIQSPSAVDAAGAGVPVDLAVDGSTFTLEVEAQASVRYPVLVDPILESYDWGGAENSTWQQWERTSTNPLLQAPYIPASPSMPVPGIKAQAQPGSFSAGNYVQWTHPVPRYNQDVKEGHTPTSYITSFTLSNLSLMSSSGPMSPYFVSGVWDTALGNWAGQDPYRAVWQREGNSLDVSSGTLNFTTGNDQQAQVAVGPAVHVSENVSISNARMMTVAGATLEYGDLEPPEAKLGSESTAWSDQSPKASIQATVTDQGLGAKVAEYRLPNQTLRVDNPCLGTSPSPCPSAWRASLTQYNTAALPQGWLSIPVWGEDVVGNRSAKPTMAEVGIDHTNPSLSPLTGSLTEQSSVGTHKLEYGLKFSATDGFEAQPVLEKTSTVSLAHPFGVAVDRNASIVWVVDRNNNMVKKFNLSGEYLGSIGKTGSGNGEFLEPRMIAVDAGGNIWVTDFGNKRIERFSRAGAYLGQFKDPSLETPYGITAAPDGSIWVSNIYSNEVVQLKESAGSLSIVRRVKGSTNQASGPLTGKDTTFYSPAGLAVDSQGNIWIADFGHNRIEEISSAGAFIQQFGGLGDWPGKLNAPYGIAVTDFGHILVADSGNNRVQLFDTQGDFLRNVTNGTTQINTPMGVAVGSNNTAFVTDWSSNRVRRWGNADLDSQSGVVKSEVLVDGIAREEYKPACSGQTVCAIPSHEWTLKPREFAEGRHSIQVVVTDAVGRKSSSPEFTVDLHPDVTPPQLTTSGSATEQSSLGATRPSYKLKIQAIDPEPKEGSLSYTSSLNSANGTGLSAPTDAAVDGKGNVWIADMSNNRIAKFNPAGEFQKVVGGLGAGAGKLNAPSAVAVDGKGNVWVSDANNNRVAEFSESGDFLEVFGKDVNKTKVEAGASEAERNLCTAASANVCQAGTAGSSAGQLRVPFGIAVTSGGNIWVSDSGNNRLEKFGPAGNLFNVLSGEGTALGKLKNPSGIAIGPDGSVWVADTGNNRIEQWNSSLTFMQAFGSIGSGNREFNGPRGVEVDPKGNVWVSDQLNHRVKKFNGSGQFLIGYGTQQPAGDSLPFGPFGLALDLEGGIYVADASNNRVQHWGPTSSSQSGLVSSTIKVDGKVVDSYNPGCSTESCVLEREWTVQSDAYSPGTHSVEATVTDGSGLSTSKSLTIAVQRDTTAPQVNSTGPLAEAPEGWVEQKSYSFTASASDPNGYGVKQIRLLIDGAAAGESTVTFCELGDCSKTKTFSVNAANYKGGAHDVAVVAEDGAGNWKKQSWTMNVDPQGTVSAGEATDTLEAMEATVPPEEQFAPVASTPEYLEPQVIEAGDNPHLGWSEGKVESSGVTVDTSYDPSTDELEIEGGSGPIRLEPTEQLEQPKLAEGAAAVLSSGSEGVSTVVRPEYDGAFMFTTIYDSAASETYTWHVHLNSGQYLVQADEQHVQVMSKTGAEAWLISADRARDATGANVPTSVSMHGTDEIVFAIHHRGMGFVYPISAGASYETSYAVVTSQLVEDKPVSEGEEPSEGGGEEVEDDELGPEPDGFEAPPSNTVLTQGQAGYLLQASRYVHPLVVPPPKPVNATTVVHQIERTRCGPSCAKWKAKVYNASYETKWSLSPREYAISTRWEPGSEVHAKMTQAERYQFFFLMWTWNCGAIGPDKVRYDSGEHLVAYGHFTVQDFYGATRIPKEKNFTLFVWVYPNGYQTRHWNDSWSGQPSNDVCPRVANRTETK